MSASSNPDIAVKFIGHLKATYPDTGEVVVNEYNAVHPQNMARVFARALANEPNYSIYRIGLGNGGTVVSAGNTITYNTPNDGQNPDTAGWQSRLYNETYSEVIDDSSPNYGSGTGTVAANDPTTTDSVTGPGVHSTENSLISLVNIDVTLNATEPTGQDASDTDTNTESQYTFDEFALFTGGRPATNTAGSQTINLASKDVTSNTGLNTSTAYAFGISINGGNNVTITITTPTAGTGVAGASTFITYRDLLALMNAKLAPLGAVASITDLTNGIETNGNLIIATTATGNNASIVIQATSLPSNWLFNHLIGYQALGVSVPGQLAGVQNNAADPTTERERLLTHVIFSPILKAANRTIRFEYTLSIAVARST